MEKSPARERFQSLVCCCNYIARLSPLSHKHFNIFCGCRWINEHRAFIEPDRVGSIAWGIGKGLALFIAGKPRLPGTLLRWREHY